MDPTIVAGAITMLGTLGGVWASRPRTAPPRWTAPTELTADDLAWLRPQLALTGQHWTWPQVGR